MSVSENAGGSRGVGLAPQEREFYAAQSTVSDPGELAGWYAELPRDAGQLARTVRDLLIHRMEGGFSDAPIPEERMRDDAETRYVDDILRLVTARDGRPLGCRRDFGDRFVGICRDFTLLHVSMLRHLGVPARMRSGFADYFDATGFHWDHVVTEFWDEERGAWRLADPQLADPERYPVDFDPADVPRDRFLVAGEAWHRIRAGQADPASFGLNLPEAPMIGAWFVAGNVRLDLAFLNKVETLLWDVWGAGAFDAGDAGADGDAKLTDEVRGLYDRAAAIVAGDVPFAAARAMFAEEDGLRTPRTVLSLAPLAGPRHVTLR
ncbi:transglutaminase-like domain-containing protein [Streptomyces sp. V4-01]|uniref:Transglutaminase-like domain-containing protein n=1 Tax=Actinacidiphila polyblastidii TaxID=3110430 RepID=A0ABU7P7I4_9ACTN|nr:transglutaminase-like domain-containing protein [Streptomyces sp. V4-01]